MLFKKKICTVTNPFCHSNNLTSNLADPRCYSNNWLSNQTNPFPFRWRHHLFCHLIENPPCEGQANTTQLEKETQIHSPERRETVKTESECTGQQQDGSLPKTNFSINVCTILVLLLSGRYSAAVQKRCKPKYFLYT